MFKKIYSLLIYLIISLFISQPTLANGLVNNPVIQDTISRHNFEPGGKYHLFNSRGSVADRKGNIGIISTYEGMSIGGNLKLEEVVIGGNIQYITKFSGHGYQEHAPFDNYESRSKNEKNGSVAEGITVYSLDWSGSEHHPADGYDGPQGGGYPVPTGARDEYSYNIKGIAQRTYFVFNGPTDFSQRFHRAPKILYDSLLKGAKKIREHNDRLNRFGNIAEAINGGFTWLGGAIMSGTEVVGINDIVRGAGMIIDAGTIHSLDKLSTLKAISTLNARVQLSKQTDNGYRFVHNLAEHYPNIAEGSKLALNLLPITFGKKNFVTPLLNQVKKFNLSSNVVIPEISQLSKIDYYKNTIVIDSPKLEFPTSLKVHAPRGPPLGLKEQAGITPKDFGIPQKAKGYTNNTRLSFNKEVSTYSHNNTLTSVPKFGNSYPAQPESFSIAKHRTLEAEIHALRVKDVMKKFSLEKNRTIAVITHQDGTVSVGFSGEKMSRIETIQQEVEKELNRRYGNIYKVGKFGLNEEHGIKQLTDPSKKTKENPKGKYGNEPGTCAEARCSLVASKNPSPPTGSTIIWRGKGPNPHPYNGINKDIFSKDQMSLCETCNENVKTYNDYINKGKETSWNILFYDQLHVKPKITFNFKNK